MWFVKNPEWFDVIVTDNMFGDIITDIAAMIQGGLGVAAGGNINPEGTSMFEPMGGSAPKYTGQNVINPIAAINAAGMMLDFLGETKAAQAIRCERWLSRHVKAAVNAPQSRRFAQFGSTSSSRSVWTAVASAPLSIHLLGHHHRERARLLDFRQHIFLRDVPVLRVGRVHRGHNGLLDFRAGKSFGGSGKFFEVELLR
jgi:hypothetical protein